MDGKISNLQQVASLRRYTLTEGCEKGLDVLDCDNGKIRYSLLPVWMLNIKYMDKMYKYAINGQTGKVVGEYPICKKKKRRFFAKAYGISFVLVLAAVLIYLFLL